MLKAAQFLLIAIAILAPIDPTHAQPVGSDDTVVIWGDTVEQMLQEPTETNAQFTQRAMQRMRRFTRETSYEASGSLCTDTSGRMGITIMTWYAHFSAPYLGGCPLATPFKGDFVHTHPLPGSYKVTKQDTISINSDRRFFKVSEGRKFHVSAKSSAQFSPNDYAIGPGYLISDGEVFYQKGRGTVRHVMTLPLLP